MLQMFFVFLTQQAKSLHCELLSMNFFAAHAMTQLSHAALAIA